MLLPDELEWAFYCRNERQMLAIRLYNTIAIHLPKQLPARGCRAEVRGIGESNNGRSNLVSTFEILSRNLHYCVWIHGNISISKCVLQKNITFISMQFILCIYINYSLWLILAKGQKRNSLLDANHFAILSSHANSWISNKCVCMKHFMNVYSIEALIFHCTSEEHTFPLFTEAHSSVWQFANLSDNNSNWFAAALQNLGDLQSKMLTKEMKNGCRLIAQGKEGSPTKFLQNNAPEIVYEKESWLPSDRQRTRESENFFVNRGQTSKPIALSRDWNFSSRRLDKESFETFLGWSFQRSSH